MFWKGLLLGQSPFLLSIEPLSIVNDLRLVLLIIGLIIIAGIYFWGTSFGSKKKRSQRGTSSEDTIGLDLPRISPGSDGDIDYSNSLIDVDDLLTEPSRSGSSQAEQDSDAAGQPADTSTQVSDRIILLYVIAPTGYSYMGPAICNAVKAVGMRYGEMGIFHHFGVGDTESEASLFGLANMVEPGSFDMQRMEEFTSPGLVLFMRLPAPMDARVAFELMLNTAQRLAELLGGDVRDGTRALLSNAKIEELRTSLGA